MNREEKSRAYLACKREIGTNYGRGVVKMSRETKEHFLTKCAVAFWFYNNGWDVYTEVQFTRHKGRADITVLHKNGDAYCVEILKSETEKRLSQKDYPFPIIKVLVKDFDYDTFCI